MTGLNQVYRCNVCGNIVEVVHTGGGTLVCCNQDMELLAEKKEDVGTEKHLPVVTFHEDKIIVNIGEINHPMEEKHYIEWIEVVSGEQTSRVYLKPTDQPTAEFVLKEKDNIRVRSYCNIHGLWENNF